MTKLVVDLPGSRTIQATEKILMPLLKRHEISNASTVWNQLVKKGTVSCARASVHEGQAPGPGLFVTS